MNMGKRGVPELNLHPEIVLVHLKLGDYFFSWPIVENPFSYVHFTISKVFNLIRLYFFI